MPKIELDYPITINGKEVNALQMRRCKVGDQKAASRVGKTDEQRETILFANLCEINPEALDELDMLDYQKLQKTYNDFLSPGENSERLVGS